MSKRILRTLTKYVVFSRNRQILVDKMILPSSTYQVFEENSAKVLSNSKTARP